MATVKGPVESAVGRRGCGGVDLLNTYRFEPGVKKFESKPTCRDVEYVIFKDCSYHSSHLTSSHLISADLVSICHSHGELGSAL